MAEEHRPKKHRKLSTTATSSPKITGLVTKILLDNAHNRFENGNFVCSPFSLEILLGMIAAGAEGKTLKQLLDFLGHETMDQLLSESRSSKLQEQLIPKVDSGGEGLDIRSSNGIWVHKKLNSVQSSYKQVLKTVYKTKARTLDFGNRPKSASKINSWVNKKTRGLIPTIIGENDLIEVVIVLANALYFKGVWSIPFEERQTKIKSFHLINGGTASVPFMTSRRNIMFEFGRGKGFKILKLPYRSDDSQSKIFSMYIFLPDMEYGLRDMIKVFDSDNALLLKKYNLGQQPLNQLWIPKFKLSYTFKPKDVMKQMGLTLPFNPTNKEFSRILEPGGIDRLHVSDIIQKCFIEIDEEGTKAAAVSLMSGRGGQPASFVADHPFMFMIREETSRAVLFMGVVLNPSAE